LLILRRFSVDFKLVPRRQAIALPVARTSGPVKSTLPSPFPGFISPSGARACAVLPRYVPISRASRTNTSSMLVRYAICLEPDRFERVNKCNSISIAIIPSDGGLSSRVSIQLKNGQIQRTTQRVATHDPKPTFPEPLFLDPRASSTRKTTSLMGKARHRIARFCRDKAVRYDLRRQDESDAR
jgi:hypothetical protein